MTKNNLAYETRSKRWDITAGVRSNPESYDLNLEDKHDVDFRNLSWHVPNYSGILAHNALKDISDSDREYVKGTQLLEFVTKQSIFEIDCVNRVAAKLAQGRYNFCINEKLKLDALKIYTDEGFHAYYTQKIADQIRCHYGIALEDISEFIGNFYEKISKIVKKYGAEHEDICMLAFVIAAENQIVSDISEQMKNLVIEPIRIMFRDHMRDEVFHALFFTRVFSDVWPQLSHAEKEVMGMCFCESMEILGKPRTDIYYYSLAKLGFDSKDVSQWIEDIYGTAEWRTTKVKERMSPTLELLKSTGVFSIAAVRRAFEAREYI